MTLGTCSWCPADATGLVVIAEGIHADPEQGTPAVPPRKTPACAPCGARIDARRAAEARDRNQREHGSRLPIVNGQTSLEAERLELEAAARRDPRQLNEPGSRAWMGERGAARTDLVLLALAGVMLALAIAALTLSVFAEPTYPATPARAAHLTGARYSASSTSYTPCSSGSVTADGTRLGDGRGSDFRTAASNRHPLGTRIRITSRQAGPHNVRLYVIRDRIGSGSELDLWTRSCSEGIRFGRRTLTYRIGWHRHAR